MAPPSKAHSHGISNNTVFFKDGVKCEKERVRSTEGAPNSGSGGQRRLPQKEAGTHGILPESRLVLAAEETDGQERAWVFRENIFLYG